MTVHRYAGFMQNMQNILRDHRTSPKQGITGARESPSEGGVGQVKNKGVLTSRRGGRRTLTGLCVAVERWRKLVVAALQSTQGPLDEALWLPS